jgi:hypothetical protein
MQERCDAGRGRAGGHRGFSSTWRLVTGGEPMTEGRHYWEIELTSGDVWCGGSGVGVGGGGR